MRKLWFLIWINSGMLSPQWTVDVVCCVHMPHTLFLSHTKQMGDRLMIKATTTTKKEAHYNSRSIFFNKLHLRVKYTSTGCCFEYHHQRFWRKYSMTLLVYFIFVEKKLVVLRVGWVFVGCCLIFILTCALASEKKNLVVERISLYKNYDDQQHFIKSKPDINLSFSFHTPHEMMMLRPSSRYW